MELEGAFFQAVGLEANRFEEVMSLFTGENDRNVDLFKAGQGFGVGDGGKGQDVEHDPQRLRPQLKAADQRDAVGHQRNDDDGADEVADRARDAETHLQRRGQDRIR